MSNFELYQENPSLFLIVLLISFVVTIFVYGAFPLIFAKTTKKPITKKKYKRLCYGLNIIGLVFFVVLNGAVSGGPYLLWTWIFSNCGLKMLNSRGLLEDNEQPNGLNNGELENNSYENVEESTEKLQQNFDLDIDKMSPQEAAEYLVAEQLGEKYIPKEKQDKKIKIKYCSQCGSQIDPVTKKCMGCGKQYFKGIKITKFTCITTIVAVFLIISVVLNIFQNIKNQELNTEIDNLIESVGDLENDIWQYKTNANFVDEYVVFVEDDGTNLYHKIDCYRFKRESFWIYNVPTAENYDYSPCPLCH